MTMTFAGMSYGAIVLAAVASFLFGGAWYGILSRQWMAAARIDAVKARAGGSAITPMVIAFVAELVMAWVLAGVIGHLGPGQVTLRNGVISAGFIWFGFVATSLVVNHAFQQASRSLTVIDGLHWLGVLLIQGAVIGWIGV